MLSSLGGLSALRRVEGNFPIAENQALQGTSQTNALTFVGGSLTIADTALTILDGFAALDHVGVNLSVRANPHLETIEAFNDAGAP